MLQCSTVFTQQGLPANLYPPEEWVVRYEKSHENKSSVEAQDKGNSPLQT